MPAQPFYESYERTDMKKILIIEDSARTITFNNRKVRTPVTLTVTDCDLKALKVQMKMADIHNWKVKVLSEKDNEVIDYDYAEPQEVIIEELEFESEPKTTLEKLMKDGDSE
jgi:transcriptional regulator NrdR family protein